LEDKLTKEIIEVPILSAGVKNIKVPVSLAVRANGFIFVAGIPGLNLETGEIIGGDIETQTEASLKALKHILESAGSSLDKVVSASIYVTNVAYFPAINRIYGRYFTKDFPVRNFVAVGSMPHESDIAIECVALS
jgi:2-iminobutanoate/2-iminopropanoate deaminase